MTVATVTIGERNGVSPGTPTNNTNNINITSAEEVNSNSENNYIVAGDFSYEKCNYIYLELINDSNKIDNFKWWITPSTPETGITYRGNLKTAPTENDPYPAGGLINTVSPRADLVYPIAEPPTYNIGVSGGNGGLTVDTTSSDFIFSQIETTIAADPGDLLQKTFHAQYDEQ